MLDLQLADASRGVVAQPLQQQAPVRAQHGCQADNTTLPSLDLRWIHSEENAVNMHRVVGQGLELTVVATATTPCLP